MVDLHNQTYMASMSPLMRRWYSGTLRERYSYDCYTKFQFLPSVYCSWSGRSHVSGSYAVQQIVEHNMMFGIPVSQRDANTLVMVVVMALVLVVVVVVLMIGGGGY